MCEFAMGKGVLGPEWDRKGSDRTHSLLHLKVSDGVFGACDTAAATKGMCACVCMIVCVKCRCERRGLSHQHSAELRSDALSAKSACPSETCM